MGDFGNHIVKWAADFFATNLFDAGPYNPSVAASSSAGGVAAVPEPSTGLFVAAGAIIACGLRRRS